MLPYGMRLGEGELDNGETIGNPVLMGFPCALIVLLCPHGPRALSDDGVENNRSAFDPVHDRRPMADSFRLSRKLADHDHLPADCLCLQPAEPQNDKRLPLALESSRACSCCPRTVDRKSPRCLTRRSTEIVRSNNRTSGRSSQWEALPQLFAVSPIWGWGPGNGGDVDYIYTHRHLIFHSLYEQIIAETRLDGLHPADDHSRVSPFDVRCVTTANMASSRRWWASWVS